MIEKPDFLPFSELPLQKSQALEAGIYILKLAQEQGRSLDELKSLLCQNSPQSERIVSAVNRTLSNVAGPATKKQRADLIGHLQRRGEELNLL